MRKVFYSRSMAAFVLDEMCACGHLKSQHGSKIVRHTGATIRLHDHGSCCERDCSCARFTWVRDVTDEEIADRIIANRPKAMIPA